MSNHTPLKHSDQNDPNEYYEIGFTSGKKIKGISQTVYASNRCPLISRKNYVPFTIVMENQEQIVVECQNEVNERMEREEMEVDRRIQEKMEQMREALMISPQKKMKVKAWMQKLREIKSETEKVNNQLYVAKVSQVAIGQRLEFQKTKAGNEAQYMNNLMKKAEQEMYQTNKLLFAAEKQHQSIRTEAASLEIKSKATRAKIKVKHENVNEQMEAERELAAIYEEKKKVNDAVSEGLTEQVLQLAVLKMQLNHFLRVGFETLKGEHSVKKKILEKNPNIWQKKNKTLYNEEILYFILIQLYPSWRRLLNQLSYHFIGYKQLLFQPNLKETDVLHNLEDYIFTNAMKKSVNKGKSYIVLYSPLEETYLELRKALLSIKGLNNGIIHIQDAKIINYEANEEFVVNYSFKNDERMKTFELVRLPELTKELISPYIPRVGADKTSVIKIEVPFCFENLAERLKMEEIYRLIERQR